MSTVVLGSPPPELEALVIEIISPGDESWAKLAFYTAPDIDEILIVLRRSGRSPGWG